VNAGDVGGQIFAAGLVDEVAMDVVPVVFGSGKRYFGSIDGQHLLEDLHVVIQGDRVLHLGFKVRRQTPMGCEFTLSKQPIRHVRDPAVDA
jgi:dihydrofolate reductase